ncbi:MAG: ATP-binding protein, partial [Anaerolineaceae bacterium]|nr:ATP-binding protein [Anaerolineaceae bacterium]
MLYKDLVQFTPIETIIQLRDADQETNARNLVQSYVISEPMANKLVDLVIPQLQFAQPRDNKGVLVVGNYGSGKSHLMSVLSAVAEHVEMADCLSHPQVKQAAAQFAGKFKVVRVEIGSVTKGLRDILLDELSDALSRWGTPVSFPPASQVNNNKNLIIQAVDTFQQKYPGMGILLVVDELLDYLRTREQRAMILDLGFLRELGEVAASCPFRFMGGLQETLFENPRFAFVAEQLRRVKDRFEQINIVREDITFVVSQRLLKKTDRQKAWITEYLRKFAPLYKSMADRMDEFVDLFPIHPAYV